MADVDSIQSQDLTLIKYCQGLKPEDKLYDLLMEMEPKSWARAQEIIRRYAQNMALKADLVEARPKGQSRVMNSMSGGQRNQTPRPSSHSPGKQRKKYDKDTKGRDKTRGGEASKSGRNSRDSSNTRVCWNLDEISDHYAANCTKPKVDKGVDSTSVTPYPRARSNSREKGGANQGGEIYIMLKGFWGDEPLVELK